MWAAIVIRPINIAAQAATMVAEFIEGALFIEGERWLDGEALFIEGELQSVGGARMLPVVAAVLPIVVVDAGDRPASAAGLEFDRDRE